MSSMCDTITRGTYLNIFGSSVDDISSDVIRDALAARSNQQLYSKLGIGMSNAAMEIAYRLYDDWDNDDNDGVISSPGVIRSRRGVAHTYHPIVGRWVPIMNKFGDVPDLSYWLSKNATNASKAREDFYLAWKDMPRSARISNPYSYYPCVAQVGTGGKGGQGCSIRIGNFNNSMNEADLVLMLSVYGPIIDVYRPPHTKRDVYMSADRIQKCKKAFYLFVEFADAAGAAALCADIDGIGGSVYFMNFPITIAFAKSRPGPPSF